MRRVWTRVPHTGCASSPHLPPVLEEVLPEDVLGGVLVIQHLGKKRSDLLGRRLQLHRLTCKQIPQVNNPRWRQTSGFTTSAHEPTSDVWMSPSTPYIQSVFDTNIMCLQYSNIHNTLTVVVKLHFVGHGLIRRRKHWTLVLQETPFGSVGGSFLLPPEDRDNASR